MKYFGYVNRAHLVGFVICILLGLYLFVRCHICIYVTHDLPFSLTGNFFQFALDMMVAFGIITGPGFMAFGLYGLHEETQEAKSEAKKAALRQRRIAEAKASAVRFPHR